MKRFFTHTRLGRYMHRNQSLLLFLFGFPLLMVSFPMAIIVQSYAWVMAALFSIVLVMLSINENAHHPIK
jgi:hypothetical protein